MTENAIVIAKRTATNFHLDLAGRLVAVSTSLLPLIEGFPPKISTFRMNWVQIDRRVFR